jgi:hypothetical protein
MCERSATEKATKRFRRDHDCKSQTGFDLFKDRTCFFSPKLRCPCSIDWLMIFFFRLRNSISNAVSSLAHAFQYARFICGARRSRFVIHRNNGVVNTWFFERCSLTIVCRSLQVSSFSTNCSEESGGDDQGDILRWKNSLKRDFTINR